MDIFWQKLNIFCVKLIENNPTVVPKIDPFETKEDPKQMNLELRRFIYENVCLDEENKSCFFCVSLKLSSFLSITLLDDLMPNQWWGWRLWSRYWNPFPNQFFSNGIFSITKRLFPKTILRMNTTLSLYLNISFPFCCIRYIIIL